MKKDAQDYENRLHVIDDMMLKIETLVDPEKKITLKAIEQNH